MHFSAFHFICNLFNKIYPFAGHTYPVYEIIIIMCKLLYIDIEDITRRKHTTLTRSSPQNPNADSAPPAEWTGFKIVGDNIDKTVRPRHMRSDRQAESLHYFHSYAVKDRVKPKMSQLFTPSLKFTLLEFLNTFRL